MGDKWPMMAILLFTFSIQALELDPQEIEQLGRGEMIVKREIINGEAWPKIKVYTTLDATPEEAMAIFAAFDYQKSYVPNILVSEVVAQPSATTVHTKYEMHMPWPLSNSKYIHGTHLTKQDNSYRINWFLVESNVADGIAGFADFGPYQNKTLLTYESHITPKSFLARVFVNSMVDDVRTSVSAIKKTIENESRERTDVLKKYLQILDRSLKGEKTYLVD
jgi:hypothetical protein